MVACTGTPQSGLVLAVEADCQPHPKKDRTPRKTTSPPPLTNPPKTGNINHLSSQCPDTGCGVSALLSRVAVEVLPYGGLYRDPTIRTGACCRGRPSTRPQEGQNPKKDNLPTALHQPTQDRQHRHISLAPMPRHRLWGLCPTVPSGSRGLALWWLVQGPHNEDWCLPTRQTVNHTQEGQNPKKDNLPTALHQPTQDRQHQPSLAPMPRHRLWGLCPTVPSGSRGLALCVCVNLTLANPSARVRCHSSPQGWQSH